MLTITIFNNSNKQPSFMIYLFNFINEGFLSFYFEIAKLVKLTLKYGYKNAAQK